MHLSAAQAALNSQSSELRLLLLVGSQSVSPLPLTVKGPTTKLSPDPRKPAHFLSGKDEENEYSVS